MKNEKNDQQSAESLYKYKRIVLEVEDRLSPQLRLFLIKNLSFGKVSRLQLCRNIDVGQKY